MDMHPQFSWLSELDMEDMMLLNDQVIPETNYMDDILPHAANFLGDDHDQFKDHLKHPSFSSSIDSTSNSNTVKQPTATIANTTKKLCYPVTLNFGSESMLLPKDNVAKDHHQECISPLKRHDEKELIYVDDEEADAVINPMKTTKPGITPAKRKQTTSTKASTQCRDHIMAERKRREKISECFVALSALVPGLKRMDKTSVLGEAIKYVKQLQERIKVLEEENARKATASFILGKRSQHTYEEDNNSSSYTDDNDVPSHGGSEQLPEIEAKLSNQTLLLKIQCEKQEKALVKILSAVEKLHLSIDSVHATPFGDTTLDITIIAQMEKEIPATPEHIVRAVSFVLRSI